MLQTDSTIVKRQATPVSILVARTDNGRQMGGRNLALLGRLVGNTNDSGMREGPVAPALRFAKTDEVEWPATASDNL